MVRRSYTLIAMLLLGGAAVCSAQSGPFGAAAPERKTGSDAVIEFQDGSTLRAEWVLIRGDKILCPGHVTDSAGFDIHDVIQVTAVTGSKAGKGLLLGTGIGFGTGLLVYLGASMGNAVENFSRAINRQRQESAPSAAPYILVPTAIGAALGLLIGSAVPVSEVIFSAAPLPPPLATDGAVLGLSTLPVEKGLTLRFRLPAFQ